jgi:hypothetical protein
VVKDNDSNAGEDADYEDEGESESESEGRELTAFPGVLRTRTDGT